MKVEVAPYEAAPWAPRLPGAKWAWRVSTPRGNTVACSSRGDKKEAERKARACAAKLERMWERYRIARNGYPTSRPEGARP